jgi:Ca2+-binding RTX toxin-like protein
MEDSGKTLNTKLFLNDAYQRGLQGTIEFKTAVFATLPNSRNQYEVLGSFVYPGVVNSQGTISNVWGNDFTISISIPKLRESADLRYRLTWKAETQQNNPSSLVSLMRSRDVDYDALAEVFFHEAGRHGNNPTLGHPATNDFTLLDKQNHFRADLTTAYTDEFNAGIPSILLDGRIVAPSAYQGLQGFDSYLTDRARVDAELRNPNRGVNIGAVIVGGSAESPQQKVAILSVADTLGVATAQAYGSQLGQYLAKGNVVSGIPLSAFIGTIAQNFAQALAVGGFSKPFVRVDGAAAGQIADNVLDDLGQEFIANLRSAAAGTVSSLLSLELGRVLGVSGFGGELLNTATSSVIGHAANNLLQFGPGRLFDGLSGTSLFKGAEVAGGSFAPGIMAGAVSSFLGAKLGSLIISPTTTEGALFSSLGSTAGTIYGTVITTAVGKSLGLVGAKGLSTLGNFIAPGVGALIGFVVGTVLGRLFFGKPPKPWAAAETSLNLNTGFWDLGAVYAKHGGNKDIAQSMALSSRDTINGVIALIAGREDVAGNGNSVAEKHKYRYVGGSSMNYEMSELVGSTYQLRYTGTDASAAVDMGVMYGLRDTKIVGGDIYLKRALAVTLPANQAPAAGLDIPTMLGNLQIAEDFGRYMRDPEVINRLIAANPNSPFAAAWAITLLRAEELGLNRFQPSDFNGGLKGFLASLDLAGAGVNFEDFQIGWGPTGYFSLYQTNWGTGGVFASLPPRPDQISTFQNYDGGAFDQGRKLTIREPSEIGYNISTGSFSAGNDVSHAPYGNIAVVHSGGTGDDIIIGSQMNDVLNGDADRDWLDGGSGHDELSGGSGDDVLLGKDGTDRLFGGDGNDYLSGGSGDDYIQEWMHPTPPASGGLFGGNGNDTLVGGSGRDVLFGEAGNDTIILDSDGGAEFDWIDGGDGADEISFERFASGVVFDLAPRAGWSWAPDARSVYGDGMLSIEGVTGTAYSDIISGDEIGNQLKGLAGNDQLQGREGNDFLEGGAGADVLDGGTGIDTASYEGAASGVSVDLESNAGFGGDASGDTFVAIENLTGSRFGDVLTGNAGDNLIRGGFGDDIIIGTSGVDRYEGGAGFDTLDFTNFSSGVQFDSVNTASFRNVATNQWSSHDAQIEAIIGSASADTLRGGAGEQTLDGRGGNDILTGGAGADTYVFGIGYGHDSVTDTNADRNGILIGEGLNFRDLSITGAGSTNLTIALRDGSGHALTVFSNFQYNSNADLNNHVIKTLDVGGSGAVDISRINWTVSGTDAAQTINGVQNKADIIFGYDGNDMIFPAGGWYALEQSDNIIFGGRGDDFIMSSSGDDQYLFDSGDGVDTIVDSGGIDTLVFGPSVAAEDVNYGIVITEPNSGRADLVITVRDPANPNGPPLNRIVIQDGGHRVREVHTNTIRPLNSLEYIRVGGQEIDLRKLGLQYSEMMDNSPPGGGGGNPLPPIAIDLDGDGIELRSAHGSRIAAVGSDGTLYRIGWLGPDDGFLALDRNGDGLIDRRSEISFIEDKEGAKTDLEGLAGHDSDGDGQITAKDAKWSEFRIWRDLNQDGVSSDNELVSLEKAGIMGISLKGETTWRTPDQSVDTTVVATASILWSDPSRQGRAHDVILQGYRVRADDGAKGILEAGGKTNSLNLESKLFGIDYLNEEQGKAAMERREKAAALPNDLIFGRVETFLEAAQTKVVDGVWVADGAAEIAEARRSAGKSAGSDVDRFANEEWTKSGSLDAERPKLSTDDRAAPFEVALTADQAKAAIDSAAKWQAFDAEILAEQTRLDTASRTSVIPPGDIAPPQSTNNFRLLPKEVPTTKAGPESAATLAASAAEQLAPVAESLPSSESNVGNFDPAPGADAVQLSSSVEPIVAADNAQIRPSQLLQPDGPSGTSPDLTYWADVQAANMLLVNAMASFGGSSSMANLLPTTDLDSARTSPWISVGSLRSTQNLPAFA